MPEACCDCPAAAAAANIGVFLFVEESACPLG
jgi:hypothetical protein